MININKINNLIEIATKVVDESYIVAVETDTPVSKLVINMSLILEELGVEFSDSFKFPSKPVKLESIK